MTERVIPIVCPNILRMNVPCPDTHGGTGAKTLKASILVFLALMSLSPVLKTLTAATSSDSIWALSACLFVLNALLADYTAMKPRSQQRER